MQFTTTAEIYQALLEGKRLRKKSFAPQWFVYLRAGMLVSHVDVPATWAFNNPREWELHCTKGTEETIDVHFECFYDPRNGQFHDFKVGTKLHDFALTNKNLSRASSRDYVKKVVLIKEDTDEARNQSSTSSGSNGNEWGVSGHFKQSQAVQKARQEVSER